jgi:hypothetical protein
MLWMLILRRLRIINNRIGSAPQNEENPAVLDVLRDFFFIVAGMCDKNCGVLWCFEVTSQNGRTGEKRDFETPSKHFFLYE